jgi:hypothetical protein
MEQTHPLEQDLDIDAALLDQATAALYDSANSALYAGANTGTAGGAGLVPSEGAAADESLALGDDDDADVAGSGVGEDADSDAGDDSEEYDSAVDDTLEEDEFNANAAGDMAEDDDERTPTEVVDDALLLAAMATGSAPLTPHPPAPGSPESPFRKCDCLGTMPGRACLRCGGSRWTKACPAKGCDGSGKITAQSRQASGPPRVERCGFCMGKGLVPARIGEISEATQLHEESVQAEKQRKFRAELAGIVLPAPAEREIQRRKPVLPSLKPKQQHKLKAKSKPGAKKRQCQNPSAYTSRSTANAPTARQPHWTSSFGL